MIWKIDQVWGKNMSFKLDIPKWYPKTWKEDKDYRAPSITRPWGLMINEER